MSHWRFLHSFGLGFALALSALAAHGQEKLTACVNLVTSIPIAAYGGQTLNAASAPKKITISNVSTIFCAGDRHGNDGGGHGGLCRHAQHVPVAQPDPVLRDRRRVHAPAEG
jgi:hypothetical protein